MVLLIAYVVGTPYRYGLEPTVGQSVSGMLRLSPSTEALHMRTDWIGRIGATTQPCIRTDTRMSECRTAYGGP